MKCKLVIKHSNGIFVDDVYTSATSMISLSEKLFAEKKFEDTAYFEPFYLKDFVAGKKKEKLNLFFFLFYFIIKNKKFLFLFPATYLFFFFLRIKYGRTAPPLP